MLFLANFGRTAIKFASKISPLSSQVKKIPADKKVYRIAKYATFSDCLSSLLFIFCVAVLVFELLFLIQKNTS